MVKWAALCWLGWAGMMLCETVYVVSPFSRLARTVPRVVTGPKSRCTQSLLRLSSVVCRGHTHHTQPMRTPLSISGLRGITPPARIQPQWKYHTTVSSNTTSQGWGL